MNKGFFKAIDFLLRPDLAELPVVALDARDPLGMRLGQACREHGVALLVVTHEPEVARQFPRRLKLEDFNRAGRQRV